jgi:hypothetical protein
MSEWKSVEVEMPRPGEAVLIHGAFGDDAYMLRLVAVRMGSAGRERWYLNDGVQTPLHGDDYPTHWMPWPEFPK